MRGPGLPCDVSTAVLQTIPRHSTKGVLALWAFLWFVTPAHSQVLFDGLSDDELLASSADFDSALAGPREPAFLQVLTEASIVRDLSQDTVSVYDLVVRYDPTRYRDPHVGIYPLSFADQFILWGKRVALFTRGTKWTSGRFFLHDISTGHHAWIFTRDARRLYLSPPGTKLPPPAEVYNRQGVKRWLKLIHTVDTAATDLRSMGLWFRLMHEESRELVIEGERERAAADSLDAGGR